MNNLFLADLVSIVKTAESHLLEILNAPDFALIGINWIDEDNHWCVSFTSEYSNHEFISIFVVCENGNYRSTGFSFESPVFQI